MEYIVVFDVVQSGYRQWWFPAMGLLFVAGTSWVLFVHRRFTTKVHLYMARFGFGFSLFWTLLSFGSTFGEYESLSSALRDGALTVGRERFDYSDYIVTAGFNHTASHGGPVREELHVRINHVGNKIARLEIAR